MSVHLKSGIIWVAFCGSGHIIWVASLDGNNLVVFYYVCPSEIRHNMGGLLWEGPYKMGCLS